MYSFLVAIPCFCVDVTDGYLWPSYGCVIHFNKYFLPTQSLVNEPKEITHLLFLSSFVSSVKRDIAPLSHY